MSINAEGVAKEVLATVRKGQKVNMGKIIRNHGYSDQVAKTIKPVTRTKSYQAVMIPALKRMETIRDNALKALQEKDMNLEDARVLKELVDSFTKNIQLLSGKATENVATIVNVVNYADVPLEVTTEPHNTTLEPVTTPLVDDVVVPDDDSTSTIVH